MYLSNFPLFQKTFMVFEQPTNHTTVSLLVHDLESSWVEFETGPYKQRAGGDGRKIRTLQIGRWQLQEAREVTFMACLE